MLEIDHKVIGAALLVASAALLWSCGPPQPQGLPAPRIEGQDAPAPMSQPTVKQGVVIPPKPVMVIYHCIGGCEGNKTYGKPGVCPLCGKELVPVHHVKALPKKKN